MPYPGLFPWDQLDTIKREPHLELLHTLKRESENLSKPDIQNVIIAPPKEIYFFLRCNNAGTWKNLEFILE